MRRYDVAIVGGGIVGLATAMLLLEKHPHLKVAILEKRIASPRTNQGTTAVYYTPGSLKARLCVRGKESLLRFCNEHAIPYKMCGKVIVALNEDELPRLNDLYQRGLTNGVPGVEMI